jgi:hypothetical protein
MVGVPKKNSRAFSVVGLPATTIKFLYVYVTTHKLSQRHLGLPNTVQTTHGEKIREFESASKSCVVRFVFCRKTQSAHVLFVEQIL